MVSIIASALGVGVGVGVRTGPIATTASTHASSVIKHLVLSGGASHGLMEIGALSYLSSRRFYERKNIQTIHATSVGSIVGSLIALDVPWEHVRNYVVDRPWDKVFSLDIPKLITAGNLHALYSKDCFSQILTPLLKSCDLSPDISLEELYGYTNIHLNFYSVRLPSMELARLSHETEPHMRFVDAVQATCAIPLIFPPLIYNGHFYIDGGVYNNYPLRECVREVRDDTHESPLDEILGITFEPEDILSTESETYQKLLNPETHNIPDFLYLLLRSVLSANRKQTKSFQEIPYEVLLPNNRITLDSLTEFIYTKKARADFLDLGERIAKEHWDRWTATAPPPTSDGTPPESSSVVQM